MIRPTMEEVKEYSRSYPVVPVGMEIYSDIKTPIQVLRNLKERCDRCFLLESVEGGEKWGRYSFLGFNPKLCVKGNEGVVEIEDFELRTKSTVKLEDAAAHPGSADTASQSTGNPIAILRQIIGAYRSPKPDYFPNFTGGFVGYFSYDFIRYTEEGLLLENRNEPGFDDFNLMLYDKVIVFDHLRQKILIIVNIDASDPERNYIDAVIQIKEIEHIIRDSSRPADLKSRVNSPFCPLFGKEEFCDLVQQAKTHIFEGDIFQAVLSNRFEADFSGDLLPVFRALRTINPSPYMFYVSSDDLQVTGASPETLVKLHNGKICTYPIAGTCPRGETPEEDERLIAGLMQNEKELSEHNMLVDLGRNDLGKVSRFGSVKVDEYQKIVRYSHVSHISSTVSGLLKDGADCFDAMAAVLPAGTLSGAPKRRACEIINRLEGHKRGIYGGAVGYIDFGGNMDLCIAIRMAVKKGGKIFVQSGAGIVADSIPENEYNECISKSKAMMDAVRLAGEALQ